MNAALKRLKEKIAQTRLCEEPTKPPKAPFVGFVGDRDRHVCPIFRAPPEKEAVEVEPQIDETEREAIAIELGGVPEIYAPAFANLQAHAPPEVPIERWHRFINDAGVFLDQWGHEAERLGWTAEELFGLHPTAPMARYDQMGLLWLLKGERVTAITAKAARLSGGLTFYRIVRARDHGTAIGNEASKFPGWTFGDHPEVRMGPKGNCHGPSEPRSVISSK